MSSDLNPNFSPSSTVSPSMANSIDSAISINIPISTKLIDSNFPTWQAQILPLINGYNLSRFIDSPPPDATRLNNTSGTVEMNLDYFPWHRQEQLLLGWIRSSLTDQIQAEVISCSTTRELWLTLKNNYTSFARSRIISLKRQIQSAQKGSQSCAQYLTSLRRIADELAFIGSPISDDDLVTYALNGLGTEFNLVVAVVHASNRHDPFSFSDLKSFILSHEALIKTQEESPLAFYTGGKGNKSCNYSSQSNQTSSGSQFTGNSQPYVHQTNSGSKSPCQIYFKGNHTAKFYYKRYNQDPD